MAFGEHASVSRDIGIVIFECLAETWISRASQLASVARVLAGSFRLTVFLFDFPLNLIFFGFVVSGVRRVESNVLERARSFTFLRVDVTLTTSFPFTSLRWDLVTIFRDV